MLPRGGAYSKHYQAEERERMKEWQSRSSRASRDREHILSKQTAQRQRALEQKKRAMEVAEEERRRRALEERRQAQREATERCKMAISRLRLSSRTASSHHHNRHRDIPIEIHFSNVHHSKEVHSFSSTGREGEGGGRRERGEGGGGGRVVLGRQVELRQDQITAVRRPPALEEVLRSIRGQPTVPKQPPPPPSPSSSRTANNVHIVKSAQSTPNDPITTPKPVTSSQTDQSDPSISINSQVCHTATRSSPSSTATNSHISTIKSTTSPTPPRSPEDLPSTEGLVFHPVVRGPLKTRPDTSKESNTIRIVSPTQEDDDSSNCSSTRGGSPVDSLSADSSDNATSASSGTRRVVRRHRKKIIKKKETSNKSKSDDTKPLVGASNSAQTVQTEAAATPSGKQIYSDTSSEDDSTSAHLPHPRSRRRRKLSPSSAAASSRVILNHHNDSGPPEVEKLKEPQQGPRIVGILKKPRGTGVTNTLSTISNQTDGKELSKKEEFNKNASTSMCKSLTGDGSLLGETEKEYGGREEVRLKMSGESNTSRDTTSMISSASTAKRVRFSDNLESSVNCSQTSIYPSSPSSSSCVSTNNIGQIWKQFMDQGSTVQSLNGMFNRHIKISLGNQRGGGGGGNRQAETGDRITIHIPQVQQRPTRVAEEDKKFNYDTNNKSSPTNNSTTNKGGLRDNSRNESKRKEQFAESNPTTTGTMESRKNEPSLSSTTDTTTRRTSHHPDCHWKENERETNHRPQNTTTLTNTHEYNWEGRVVPVAPQIYQFSPTPQTSRPPSSGGQGGVGGGGNRYLPHRQQQKPSHYHGNSKQLHHSVHHVTHAETYKSESSYMVAMQPSSWQHKSKSGVMDLSFEEQKLTHSLQKINQRLKEHERTHGSHASHSLNPPPPHNPPHLLQPSQSHLHSTHRLTTTNDCSRTISIKKSSK